MRLFGIQYFRALPAFKFPEGSELGDVRTQTLPGPRLGSETYLSDKFA